MRLTKLGRRMIDQQELQRARQRRSGGSSYGRGGPSNFHVRRLLEHQRWLNSEGRFGERLELDWKSRGRGGRQIDFIESQLSGVAFSKALLTNLTFAFSDLKYARFDGAEMQNVRFIGCDIEGADFSGATLNGVSFEEETNYQKALIGNANVQGVLWDSQCAPPTSNSLRIDLSF